MTTSKKDAVQSSIQSFVSSPTARVRALWLVFFVFVLTLVLAAVNIKASFVSPLLLLVLNVLFISLVSFVSAALAAVSFMRTGSWPVLWFGSGALTLGIASTLGGFLSVATTYDQAVTAHNTGALLASVLNLAVAFLVSKQVAPHPENQTDRQLTLTQVYLGPMVVLVAVVVLDALNLVPPFFVPGSGPTQLRELVLGTAVFLYFVAAVTFLRLYFRTRGEFIYWYALGLLLTSLGLLGVWLEREAGTPIYWLGLGVQYLGSIYLLAAVFVVFRQSRAAGLDIAETLAAFFQEPGANYRLLFDAMIEAVAAVDGSGKVLMWNPAAESTFGYSPEEALGKGVADLLFPPSYGWRFEEELKKLTTEDEALVTREPKEIEAATKSGRQVKVRLSFASRKTPGGWFNVLVLTDVTERRKMEADLAHLASFPQLNPAPVVEVDAAGNISYMNPAAKQLFPDLPTMGSEHPFLANWAVLFNTLRSENHRPVSREVKLGDSWYEQTIFYATLTESLRFYSRDISLYKQAREVRKELFSQVEKERDRAKELGHLVIREKEILSTIMENAGAMLAYFDVNFNFVRVNSAYARGSGYGSEGLIGRNHFALFPNEENQRIFEQVRDTGAPAQFYDKPFVYAGQPERGVTYWDWTLVSVLDESGKVGGLVLSLVETTQRVRDQQRIRAFERLATIGQLSGNISHELRNPLATIDSSVFYLKSKLKDADSKVLAHLDRIKSSVDRSVATIQKLVELTRAKELRMEKCDLRAVMADLIATLKLPEQVAVVTDFPMPGVMVGADAEYLRLAFRNIVSNAVEAMGDVGTLTVTLRASDDTAELSFADTGPGIPPENLDQIFEPLFTTKAKGIGLGLAITKMVIEKHSGTIAATSELGKGATIVIRLPLYSDGASNPGGNIE